MGVDHTFEFIVLLVSAVLTAGLGVVVFLRNVRSRTYRHFLLFTVAAAGWIVTNGLFFMMPNPARFIDALISYGMAGALGLFFFLFTNDMTGRPVRAKYEQIIIAVSVLVIFLSCWPGIVANSVTSDFRILTNPPMLVIFSMMLLGLFALGVGLLCATIIRKKGRRERRGLGALLIGFLVSALGGLVCNLLLPAMGEYNFVAMGPSFSLVFVALSAYAIIRHGLFDIRSLMMKATAYVLATGTLIAGYFVAAYLLSTIMLANDVAVRPTLGVEAIVIGTILALVFQPIKLFFDKLTRKFFYSGRYDSDDFMSGFNRTITSASDLPTLLEDSVRYIVSGLNLTRGVAVGISTKDIDHPIIRSVGTPLAHEALDRIHEALQVLPNGVFLADKLEIQSDFVHIQALLRRSHIEIAIPVVQRDGERTGYFLLGTRKEGEYTMRDIRLLEMVAGELGIAIQNARSLEKVNEINSHLQQKVSEATRELRHTNSRLVEMDATKDEFISMASHQLRTPLTSVKGYISMVLEGDAGKISDTQRQLLGEAFTSSERMVHLISDFLNVSRLQTGKFNIDRRECDLAKIIQQEVEGMLPIAEAHQVRLVYRQPPRPPILYLDEGKLRQVIMNMIDNAIYYSHEHTAITVRLSTEDGALVFRVIDTGIGVPLEAQAKLFTKFFRAENARIQRPDGTGIGLFLAKKVIDGHGGSMVFESKSGDGSIFGFRLPIKKLSVPPTDNEVEHEA